MQRYVARMVLLTSARRYRGDCCTVCGALLCIHASLCCFARSRCAAVSCFNCCRPSWFAKYRDCPSSKPGRTIVYFAADRTALQFGNNRDQQQRGFCTVFYSMAGAASFAGYDGYLSSSFGDAPPGVAMVNHLLAGGTVSSYPGTTAADNITKARFRPYAFRGASTLLDRCKFVCNGTACPAPPACAAEEALCNQLSGDTSCCDKQDGDRCLLRGRASTCQAGKCKGESRCAAQLLPPGLPGA
jgi:hypothetical protein